MGKKDTEMDDLQPDDDLNFDDFNFDDDEFDPDGRKPASSVSKYGIVFGKQAGKAYGKKVLEKISEDMPNTVSLVRDSLNVKNELFSLKDEAHEQVGTLIRETKKTVRPLLTYAEKLLPRTIYDKLDKLTQYEEDYQENRKSKAEEREDLISSQINAVFSQQAKVRKAELIENRTNRVFDVVRGEEQHRESLISSSNIVNELKLSNAFLNSSVLAYMKKSIELKYRHLFVAQDSLELGKATLELLNLQLPKITHNTELPDAVKTLNSELFKEQMKIAAIQTFRDKIGNFIPKALENLRTKTKETLTGTTDTLGELQAMTSMLADEDMQEMLDPKEQIVGLIADLVGGIAAGPLGERFRTHFGPEFTLMEDKSKNYKEKIYRAMLKKRDDLASHMDWGIKGTAKDMLVNLLDSVMLDHDENVYYSKQDLIKTPFKPTTFDISTRQAIVEIIPGYLSKMLKQISDLANGRDNEEMVFDQNVGNFVTRTQLFERIKTSSLNYKQDGMNTALSIGKMRGMYALNKPKGTSLQTFNDQISNIKQFMFNVNKTKKDIDYEELIYFRDNPDKGQSSYITDVYKNVENPQELNNLIIDLISTNGKVDQNKITDFYNTVIEAGTAETHLSKLREALQTPGYARILDDFGILDDRDSVKSKINTKWMDKEVSKYKLNDLDNEAYEIYGQRGYLEEKRKLEERKIKQIINQLDYIQDGSEEDFLKTIAEQEGLSRKDYNAVTDLIREREKKKKDLALNQDISKRFDDKNVNNLLSGSTGSGSIKNLKPLLLVSEGIKTTADKIYEFLTGQAANKDKEDNDPNFLKNKFSFLEDILLMGIETNEKGFENLEKKLNINLSSAGAYDYSSSIDEIKNTLQAHMNKSAEDRANMLNLMSEMNFFNYHQGDFKKAGKYLRNAVKWTFKSPFKLAEFGIKKSWDFSKFTLKSPIELHKKMKGIFGDDYLKKSIKKPFDIMGDMYGHVKDPLGTLIAAPLHMAAFPFKIMANWGKNKNSFKNRFKQFRKRHYPSKGKVPKYFDVYKEGTNTIVLFKEVQEEGVLLANGQKLERTIDIDQPVIGKEKPHNILISQKDVDEGLCDENGVSLKSLAQQHSEEEQEDTSSGSSINWKDKFKKLGEWGAKGLKGAKDLAKGGLGLYGTLMTPMNKMIWDTLKFTGGLFGKAKDKLLGKSSKKENRIIKRLDIIIKLMNGEPPDDYEESSEGVFATVKNTAKSMFDKVRKSKFMADETGSVDMSFLNRFKKKSKPSSQGPQYKSSHNQDYEDIMDFYKDRYGDDDDEDVVLQAQGNSILSKISAGISKLTEYADKDHKKKDIDGDGQTDGKKFGWGKLKEKFKKKNPDGSGGVDGADAKKGFDKLKGLLGKKGKNKEVASGVLDLLTGGAETGGLLKILRGSLGMGGGAATAGGAAAGGAVAAEGAAAGAAASWPVLLGIAAVGATAYAGYKIKSFFDKKNGVSISGNGKALYVNRRFKYGIMIKGADEGWVLKLERTCYKYLEQKIPIALSPLEKAWFMSKCSLDCDDPIHRQAFENWFGLRFVPIFKQYIEILEANKLSYFDGNMIQEDDQRLLPVLSAVKGIKVPDDSITLTNKELKDQKNKEGKMVRDPVTGKMVPDDGLSPELRQIKADSMKEEAFKDAGESNKSWWQKSPWQVLKEKFSQSSLDNIDYDPKYKFDGDQAKLYEKTKAWIKGHEGLRLSRYNDSRGLNTIGYGHLNLENYDTLSKADADKLFDRDVDKHLDEANKLPEFKNLDPVRQMAVLDLIFNMGRGKFMSFVKTRELLAQGKYPEAAAELLRSDYANQVGSRAKEVAAVLKTGDPKYIKPRAVDTIRADRSKMSEQDITSLSNKQYGDDFTGGSSPNTVESKAESLTMGIPNEDGGKTPAVPTNKIVGSIPSIPGMNGQEGTDYVKEKDSVHMDNLNPKVKDAFEKMAYEYKQETGKPITVTSAYRTKEEQARLYAEKGKGKAAKPGSSLHEFGYALDIDSPDANWLADKGVLAKYGFERPLLSKGEKWHIQPIGVDKDKVRSGEGLEEGSDPKSVNLAGASTKDLIKASEANPNASSVFSGDYGTDTKVSSANLPKAGIVGDVANMSSPKSETPSEPIDTAPKEQTVKVDVNNDKVVDETVKTNQLLSNLINLLVPVVEQIKKQGDFIASAAKAPKAIPPKESTAFKFDQSRKTENFSMVIDPTKRG